MTPSSIAVITVQFNNPDDTGKLVQSLSRLCDLDGVGVIVVDNSTDPTKRVSAKALQTRAFNRIEVLRPEKNLYYWGGADYAIRHFWRNIASLPDWIVVCNNDLTFDDNEFFTKILTYDVTSHPIIGPRILSSRGDQNPLLESPPRFLTRAKWRVYDVNFTIAKMLLGTHAAVSGAIERMSSYRSSSPRPREIYAPHGACMIFSRSFFDRGGELDTTVPMFAEELTIAAVAKRLRMPVWYDPTMFVVHREHSTTGPTLTRQKYQMERAARRRYYALKRDGRG